MKKRNSVTGATALLISARNLSLLLPRLYVNSVTGVTPLRSPPTTWLRRKGRDIGNSSRNYRSTPHLTFKYLTFPAYTN